MRVVILVLLAVLLPVSSFAGNDPPPASNVLWGFYFSNFTLTVAAPGPDYYVIGDVFVQPGVTMHIEPGVTVHFSANFDTLNGEDYFNDSEIILLDAILNAVGTSTDSISFVSDAAIPQPGDWGQIKFKGSSQGSFEYVNLSHASVGIQMIDSTSVTVGNSRITNASGNGITLTDATILVHDAEIRDSGGSGISQAGGSLEMSNSAILSGMGFGISANGGELRVNQSNLEALNNGWAIQSHSQTGEILNNTVRNCRGGFRLISSSCKIQWNAIEEITGASNSYSGIQIDGNVTDREPILGNVIRNVAGYGINLSSTSPDTIVFCDIFDCGQGGVYAQVVSTNTVHIANSLIVRCPYGIRLFDNSSRSASIDYCTVVASSNIGIELSRNTGGAPNYTLRNSIIVSGGQGVQKGSPVNAQIEYCNIWNNTANYVGTSCDVGCQIINPLFVDSANDDYTLLNNSPLRVLGENGTQMGRYGPDPGSVTGLPTPGDQYKPVYILGVYPNPFSQTTTITLMARESGSFSLDLFSITGALVRSIKDKPLYQGVNEVQIQRAGIPAGLYFYRVESGGIRDTGKLVISQ